jgi:small GTP-binding protein
MSFKVFIVGDPGVGKTSMMLRFIDDTFLEDTAPTSGGQPGKKRQIEVDGKNVEIILFDTDGQERFGNITCSLYQGMHGFIIAYDVNNTETFKAVDNWVAEMERYARSDVVVFMVGNKTDLDNRQVSAETAEKFAQDKGYPFMETSAKTGENVEELFSKLAQAMVSRYTKTEARPAASTLNLGGDDAPPKKKKGCTLF